MKLTVTSYTVTTIPALIFNAAPNFAYPSGGNPQSVMVLTPSTIAAIAAQQTPVPGGIGAGVTAVVVSVPVTLVGAKTSIQVGSVDLIAYAPVGGDTFNMDLLYELLLDGVVQYSIHTAAGLPPGVLTFNQGIQSVQSPTVAGVHTAALRITNNSFWTIAGPVGTQPFTAYIQITEY